MSTNSIEFPLQFQRQYAGPLDKDSVFTTTAARLAYLTNARRYPGQPVVDLEEGKQYFINAAGSGYTQVGGDTRHDVEFLTYSAMLAYDTSLLQDGSKAFVWDASGDTFNTITGYAYYRYNLEDDKYYLLSKGDSTVDLSNYYTKAEVDSEIANSGGGGHIIANDAESLPQRAKLRFSGDVTVTDGGAIPDETVVTITAPTLTDAEIKDAYENNPDTNAFTDDEKVKLAGVSGTNTGDETKASIISKLEYTPADTTDPRFTNERVPVAGSVTPAKLDTDAVSASFSGTDVFYKTTGNSKFTPFTWTGLVAALTTALNLDKQKPTNFAVLGPYAGGTLTWNMNSYYFPNAYITATGSLTLNLQNPVGGMMATIIIRNTGVSSINFTVPANSGGVEHILYGRNNVKTIAVGVNETLIAVCTYNDVTGYYHWSVGGK